MIVSLDVLVAIPFASLRLEQRPIRFAVLKLSGILLNIMAVLFFLEIVPRLAANGSGFASWYAPEDRLLYVFVANLIGSAFVFVAFLPRYFRINYSFDGAYVRRMLVYALPLVIVGIAGIINQSGYIVFLKAILPGSIIENMSEGGVYAAATRIALLMSLFITAFNYAAEPFFFNQSNDSNAKQTYADVALAFTITGSGIFVGIMMYLDIIQRMLGHDFRTGLYVVPILLLAFFFLGLYYNFSIWYKLVDKTRYGMYISLGGAVITVGLNLILIPMIGSEGSAWAALVCYAFMATACFVIGKRHFPVPYSLQRMAAVLIAALVSYGLSVLGGAFFEMSFVTKILVNTVILAAFVVVLYRLEGGLIKSVVRKSNG